MIASFLIFKLPPDKRQGPLLLFRLAVLLYPPFSQGRVPDRTWILLVLVFLIELGYIPVYMIGPVETRFHVITNLYRLLFLTGVTAFAFSFEIFWQPERSFGVHSKKEADLL